MSKYVCVSKRVYIYIYIFSDTFIIIDPSQSYQGVWPGQPPIRLHAVTALQGISATRCLKTALQLALPHGNYLRR